MNKPYKAEFDAKGNCINLITKNNPYFNLYPNRQNRRGRKVRHRGNNKGVSLIVTDVSFTERTFQYLKDKVIMHYIIKYFKQK